jgi:hypothetical protein
MTATVTNIKRGRREEEVKEDDKGWSRRNKGRQKNYKFH